MKVNLIWHTPEPERVVAMAARLCYSPVGAAELAETMSDGEIKRLVEKIVGLGHASTLEHASFTFAIEGVSRVLTHQLVRHRIASYSQQSQRYVEERDFAYITPPSVAEIPAARKTFEELMRQIRRAYGELVSLGVHKEDVRYCLANAAETKIVVTMNARALQNFFALRCCERAQWEIRALANEMLEQAKKVAPILFRRAGAPCAADGKCPEGEMTCGKFAALAKGRQKSKND